jgi:GNAT superfamily N-acetyltransferase
VVLGDKRIGTIINIARKTSNMSYSSRIIRKFIEMPVFDDSQLALGSQPQKDQDTNDKRFASLSRLNKHVGKLNLPDNVSMEMLENKEETNFIVYLVQNIRGGRHVVGMLDIMDNGYPFPSVQMSYVDKEFQGKGYSKLMYKMAIKYLGGLVSDAKLTGEQGHGSFNIWQSLGKELYTYIIDDNNEPHEVGQFDKSMMRDENTRFMVLVEELEPEY